MGVLTYRSRPMLDSIKRFFTAVLIVMFAAAGLIAIFYTAYLFIFLILVAILSGLAAIIVNWKRIIEWADED